MILQSCSISTPQNCFMDPFLVLHLKKSFYNYCFSSFKKRPKILKSNKLHSYYCFNSLSSNFKVQGLQIDAGELDDATTKIPTKYLKYDDLVWPSPSDEIPFWKKDFPFWETKTEDPINTPKDSDPMHIVHVTAEMAPIAKVGGLGDVVTGLARACLTRGHKVDVFLPFYECINKMQMEQLTLISAYNSYFDERWVPTNVYQGVVLGISVVFIEPLNQFFKGQSVYGGSYDELESYLFFSRACLEWLQVSGTQPDIIHVHEWQTGVLPLLYWDMYHYLSLKKPRIVLTIHNMEHYGECRSEELSNTVSPTYLKETLCSGWLAGTLIRHRDKYFGILNGIDTAIWNPATDKILPAKFDAKKVEGKKICKTFVQRGLGLDPDKAPLVVCITRLVAQKGLHLIANAIRYVEALGGQMVILGTAPDARVGREFEGLAQLHNQGSSIRILLMYSEELSHMLYAAGDIVLVPSIYEPCGLAQMIGMRYGAVPVVRKTGGLADTVFDMDDKLQPEMANGFVFEGIDEGSLNWALDRAFSYYRERPNEWREIVKKVMEMDNSWDNTAGNSNDERCIGRNSYDRSCKLNTPTQSDLIARKGWPIHEGDEASASGPGFIGPEIRNFLHDYVNILNVAQEITKLLKYGVVRLALFSFACRFNPQMF
ncbi:probable starch synthase 4 chloroplastic/amyloplastic [Phtheirospermum japonicum]|uniref:starch synthase n=1 Tax=Phtheirospermum japonicum TaxID=374723 RepID=A0A830BKN7_9LAMI|nr:probable starch synthase 4 chloroplastic/amyloplastic [Phtheirospermum japonicum]